MDESCSIIVIKNFKACYYADVRWKIRCHRIKKNFDFDIRFA